ncbi:hypothetical protein UNDKW_0191 [Undibacterium sp. KW1]|uniref:hypothetical protein n=1 Tax=Undibacterium sp. KW1 TaxID=2058624 RepID=UPI001331F17D|nr:hypothetical protein [Undibacterium sp. KW1]BBB58464.1 hypothetical protein UNDKW_0191 [Undibacterium sp. KW1]
MIYKTKNVKSEIFASTDAKFDKVPKYKIPTRLATIFWFHSLKMSLDVESISAVQQLIEPVIDEPDGGRDVVGILRRWNDYKNGHHKPIANVVHLAEERVPGTEAIFKCPLWNALRLDKSEAETARTLLGTTTKLGDELLLRMLHFPQTIQDPRWIKKRCKALVAHGSLEGLAVLTICIRLANKSDLQNRLAFGFYLYATDCLIVMGFWFYLHGIAQVLGEYFEQTFLPMTGMGFCGNFSSSHYLYTIQSLAKTVLQKQEVLGRELSYDGVISEIIRLIEP